MFQTIFYTKNSINSLKFISIFSLVFILAACETMMDDTALVRDRSNDYLLSQEGPSIVLPAQFNTAASKQYLIPALQTKSKRINTIAPPGSLTLKQNAITGQIKQPALAQAALKQITNQDTRSLLIKQPYQQAWASVNSSLNRQQIPILESNEKQHFFKIADLFLAEAGVKSDGTLYYLTLNKQKNDATLVQIKPINNKQRLNIHTQKRLLTQLAAGLAGRYKKRSLLEMLKSVI